MVINKRSYREQRYDFFGVVLAIKNKEFTLEESHALQVVAHRYINRCNDEDAMKLALLLGKYTVEVGEYGPAAVCREIIRAK